MTTTWKELLLGAGESISHVKPSSFFFQLSTLGLNGSLSNRTVVFRGFEDNTDRIQIHTDHRNRKVQEIKNRPVAEWLSRRRVSKICNGLIAVKNKREREEYYRLLGLAEKRKGLRRERAWYSCSVRSRMQYLGPAPGLPHLMETEHSSIQNSLDPEAGPVGAFCLLVFDPDEIDYLNLKSNSRLNFTSSLGPTEVKCWTVKMINP